MYKKILKSILYVFWYLPCILLCLIVFRILNRTEIKGKENIPRKGGMLVMVNHVSALDSWLIGPIFFPRAALFPAKAELFKNPLLSVLFRGWGAFPVIRGRHNIRAMEKIVDLANHNIVVIHPEGTRSRSGEIGTGTRGVGKIIYESSSPVIPICTSGMEKFLPTGKYFPSFFKSLRINIGKSIDPNQYKNLPPEKDTYRQIVDELMFEIRKLKNG